MVPINVPGAENFLLKVAQELHNVRALRFVNESYNEPITSKTYYKMKSEKSLLIIG